MARSRPARGVSEIRKALAEYVAMKPTIQLTTRRVVQGGGHRLAYGRLGISRNHQRWQKCINLWHQYRSRSSRIGRELALLHRPSRRARLIHLPRIRAK